MHATALPPLDDDCHSTTPVIIKKNITGADYTKCMPCSLKTFRKRDDFFSSGHLKFACLVFLSLHNFFVGPSLNEEDGKQKNSRLHTVRGQTHVSIIKREICYKSVEIHENYDPERKPEEGNDREVNLQGKHPLMARAFLDSGGINSRTMSSNKSRKLLRECPEEHEKELKASTWSSYSPDLNPIRRTSWNKLDLSRNCGGLNLTDT